MLDGFDLSRYTPNLAGLGSSLLNIGLIIVVLFILAGIGLWIWNNARFKYKIEIYENLGGTRYVQTGIDKARIVKIGETGEEILVLKARKKIVTSYNRKMGPNLIWFAIGQDGYWYNVILGDLDCKQGMLDIEPIDRDMRMAYVSIGKNARDRYNKPRFMEKYGSLIMNGIFLIIVIVGIGFLINKLSTVATSLADTMRSAVEVSKLNQQVLSSIDNIRSSSGIKIA